MAKPSLIPLVLLFAMALEHISDKKARKFIRRIRKGKKLRQKFPSEGRINIERELPYLLIYRYAYKTKHTAALRLVLSESSYIICDIFDASFEDILHFIKTLSKEMAEKFGSFLLMEIWVHPEAKNKTFTILEPKHEGFTVGDTLEAELTKLVQWHPDITVDKKISKVRNPKGFKPLMTVEELKDNGCLLIGLELPGFFQESASGKLPVFIRNLHKALSQILRKTIHQFIKVQTTATIEDYRMLGRLSVDRSVWHIDNKLAEIDQAFDFLLLVSPINNNEAWAYFKKHKFEKKPAFRYRLLPIDPEQVKRQLYNLNMHKIDDPSLAFLLRDKRDELDQEMTMLGERGTKNFFYNSIRMFNGIDDELLNTAKELLETIQTTPAKRTQEPVGAEALKAHAEAEILRYQKQSPDFIPTVELRNDIPSLMVSKGNLLIPENIRLAGNRVVPLLHHELGTHSLTYYNGKAQPFQQLYSGLAGYDELQEGLAVITEYLCGGLTAARMRMLAARVLSGHYLMQGASFVENFKKLRKDYDFSEQSAYFTVTRIYQSGGFLKDIIYLRGLLRLLKYLEGGKELEPLFIGKIAEKHIPIIEELRYREVLVKPPLTPHILMGPKAKEKLEKLKQGLSPAALYVN